MAMLDERTAVAPPSRPPETSPSRDRMLWAVAVMVVLASLLVVLWVASDEPMPLADEVSGFEYDHEVTAIHLRSPNDPAPFVGEDAALDPDG